VSSADASTKRTAPTWDLAIEVDAFVAAAATPDALAIRGRLDLDYIGGVEAIERAGLIFRPLLVVKAQTGCILVACGLTTIPSRFFDAPRKKINKASLQQFLTVLNPNLASQDLVSYSFEPKAGIPKLIHFKKTDPDDDVQPCHVCPPSFVSLCAPLQFTMLAWWVRTKTLPVMLGTSQIHIHQTHSSFGHLQQYT